ncbi:MAG: hypothetical protein KAV82_15585 [Phycisphaerae bacterium]|nr:hypothetical protein [Phycisphaerae bacterium]
MAVLSAHARRVIHDMRERLDAYLHDDITLGHLVNDLFGLADALEEAVPVPSFFDILADLDTGVALAKEGRNTEHVARESARELADLLAHVLQGDKASGLAG